MAQIASSDVTYTEIAGYGRANPADTMAERAFSVVIGNGTLTYTNGGVPLDKTKLGCPNYLHNLQMLDAGSGVGYVAKWNQTANTIRLYQDGNVTAAAAAALTEILTSAVVTAITLRCIVKGY
jgi:hypothetical protein